MNEFRWLCWPACYLASCNSRHCAAEQLVTPSQTANGLTLELKGLVRTITRILGGSAMFMASPIAPSVITACIQTIFRTSAYFEQDLLQSHTCAARSTAIARSATSMLRQIPWQHPSKCTHCRVQTSSHNDNLNTFALMSCLESFR